MYPHLLPDTKERATTPADRGEEKVPKQDSADLVVSDVVAAIREVLDKHYPTPELEMVGLGSVAGGDDSHPTTADTASGEGGKGDANPQRPLKRMFG